MAEPAQLTLDTSTDTAGLCISRAGAIVAEYSWAARQNHTATLLPALDRVLSLVGLTPADVNGIAVALGPGSFNGLRVGLATAKGLALALNVPLVGVSTLEATAYLHRAPGLPVCAIHDAGRKELSAAVYRQTGDVWERLMEEQIISVADLAAHTEEPTVFCGELPDWARPALAEALAGRGLFAEGIAATRRPGAVAELAWKRLAVGDADDAAALQPLYLRRPNVTEPRRRPGTQEGPNQTAT
ncbi:MAG: tRNA (adenosine(37)-N6)-threonylcarbamoyltransferase complex dimerization subunit type 1 TsaB [Chloroflexi bacterium]|nr:tRNA (adenosine(37)-N6)-threonylcarbamoyltransferase complex dimerization subunit type 1 TsaB [Chloroflexota bacterium]